MGPPRGGKHGNVCAHGEEQAQQHWLPDKATLSSIITMGYAYKKEQANVIQSSQRRQFYRPVSFECCRKKEKPYGKLEQPMKCSRVNNSLQAAVETKTGSTAALPSSQLVLPTPGWAPGWGQVLLLWKKMLNSLINWDCWIASLADTQAFQEPVGIMEWPEYGCYFSSSIWMYRALKCTLFLGIWMYSWWRFSLQSLQSSNSSGSI